MPEAAGSRVGLLAQTGEKAAVPSEWLPTGLGYRARDSLTGTLSEPIVLKADDGRCVECAEGVAAAIGWASRG